MTPADLTRIGEAIWGEYWVAPMARAMNVDRRTVFRWRKGVSPTPDDLAERLMRWCWKEERRFEFFGDALASYRIHGEFVHAIDTGDEPR